MPNGQVMTGRQDADSSFTLSSRPTPRLFTVFRAGVEEEVNVRVVHLHLVVFILKGKRSRPHC